MFSAAREKPRCRLQRIAWCIDDAFLRKPVHQVTTATQRRSCNKRHDATNTRIKELKRLITSRVYDW